MRRTAILFVPTLAVVALIHAADRGLAADEPASVTLAEGGRAGMPIRVAPDASPRVRAAAETLAAYLNRMSGATFAIETSRTSRGIAVGLAGEWRAAIGDELWREVAADQREEYLLRTHADGLLLVGATELAVEHAVWDLLYRLGHRQFFPGETWEIVPTADRLRIAVDAVERPAYHARRIWYGFGAWDYAAEPYRQWCEKNRAVVGIDLRTGHAYDGVQLQNRAVFEKHPEYLALVDGRRTSNKFCISNRDLRKLFVDHKLAEFASNPDLQCVSVDPSDGGGWCECEACAALGSVSDRAVLLANEVAGAAEEKYGEKFVGMYAYNYHAPPPNIRVHPNVIISIATSFIKGDYTVEQLAEGWRRQGATLGIRDYFSVNTWDRDLPGRARGGSIAYLKQAIPHYHSLGARFYSAESSDNWGPNGLGYYLAARMMWNVQEAQQVDERVDDFLIRSFGPASEPMRRYYELIDGSHRPLLSDDLLGRMYRELADAYSHTDEPSIRRRLDDLVLYTHYVERYRAYSESRDESRQQAFESLIRYAWRIRETMMIHAKALYRDLANRDRSVSIPADAAWNVPEERNPWKSSDPFTSEEIAKLIRAGIQRHDLLDFTPIAFSEQLVPATPLDLPAVRDGSFGVLSRGNRSYYTWVEQAPTSLRITGEAGLIYDSRGPAKLALFPTGETLGQAVASAEIPPDKQAHERLLATTYSGLHRVELSDRQAGTRLRLPDHAWTVPATRESPAVFNGRWSLYFYVPKGTKVVGGFSNAGQGRMLDADGTTVHEFQGTAGYFSVPVAAGQDGRLWQFAHSAGERFLMTVPPYLARNEKELLLPAEVVAADKAR